MNKIAYENIVKKEKINNHLLRDCLLSFLCGGFIALSEEFLYEVLLTNKVEKELSIFLVNAATIFIVICLTYFAQYKKLGQIFGAGLFFPLTGFSNSVASSAFSGKNKGLINGVGSKILTLSGSVIVYGLFISFYFSTIYYLLSLFGINVW